MRAKDLDLPIRRQRLSGPGVDWLKRRKEPDDAPPFTEEQLLSNWLRVRDSLTAGFRRVLSGEGYRD